MGFWVRRCRGTVSGFNLSSSLHPQSVECKDLNVSIEPFPRIMDREDFLEAGDGFRVYEMILMATNVAKKLGLVAVLGAVCWVGKKQGLFTL